MAPEELRDIFAPLVDEHAYNDEEKSLAKRADILCAHLKYLEEPAAGNNEFLLVKARLETTLEARCSQEIDYLMEAFVLSLHFSLDEINQDSPLQAAGAYVASGNKRWMRHQALVKTETASGSSPHKPLSR